MTSVFLTIINMSITATFAALIILIIRFLILRKLPKSFSYALWGIVLLRLIMPFSFSSALSIMGKINPDVGRYGTILGHAYTKSHLNTIPLSHNGIQETQLIATDALTKAVESSANIAKTILTPGDYILLAGMILWLIGIAGMLVYSTISYIKLVKMMQTAVPFPNKELISHCQSNIKLKFPISVYVSDLITGPFVCGVFRPKIILPSFLLDDGFNEQKIQHVLLHEMVHVKRFDFIIKPLAFLALGIHWFNPVMWICFQLAMKDMEMACDERVIKILKTDHRGSYATTLLCIAMKQNGIFAAGSLAFGESNISERVKNIVKYKTPRFWVTRGAALFIICLGIVLLANPIQANQSNHQVINVLFMGSIEAPTEEVTVFDTIILMGYEPRTGKINLVSVPRDTMIASDPSITSEPNPMKLGRYAALHSPDEVMQQLSHMLGVSISNYVKLDTATFRNFVDAIGGIEFNVPQDMYYEDPMQGLLIDLKKGPQILDGENAEMLIRYRKGYLQGDLTRMDVQKDVISAILTKKMDTQIAKNIKELYHLASKNIDTNMDKRKIKEYVSLIRKTSIRGDDINKMELPLSITIQDATSYAIIDETKAQQLMLGNF